MLLRTASISSAETWAGKASCATVPFLGPLRAKHPIAAARLPVAKDGTVAKLMEDAALVGTGTVDEDGLAEDEDNACRTPA